VPSSTTLKTPRFGAGKPPVDKKGPPYLQYQIPVKIWPATVDPCGDACDVIEPVRFSAKTGACVVKLTLRDKESAQEAVRRFRKLVERSGIKKEMRVREFYEKPSEIKRRARLRAQRRARRERFFATH
jgi:small subunit ribosomal protein S21